MYSTIDADVAVGNHIRLINSRSAVLRWLLTARVKHTKLGNNCPRVILLIACLLGIKGTTQRIQE